MMSTLNGVVPYPPEFVEYYRQKGYWLNQNLDAFLQETVKKFPNNTAIICQSHHISYTQFNAMITQCASGLFRYGLRPGDRVVLQLPNRYQIYVVFFALIRLGVLPIMSLPAHRHAEINSFIQQTDAVGYFCADIGQGKFDYREQARICQKHSPTLKHVFVLGEAQEFYNLDSIISSEDAPISTYASDANEIAFLQLSGGSTGISKLIPRTHDDYLYSVRESAQICGLTAQSRLLMVLPAAHNFSMSSAGALGIFYQGGCVVLSEDASADHAFNLIQKHCVTDVCLVPPLVTAWLEKTIRENDSTLSQLNTFQVGGARLSSAVAKRVLTDFKIPLQQVFGMAEGLVHYTQHHMTPEQIINTQGIKISPDDEVLVLDDYDQPVKQGQVGHLLTRGPYTIRGYFNAPEHNQIAFTPDGFYRTGDLVRIRADGCIVVEGRVKEQINRGGEKIATEEVEQVVMSHPDVLLAALIGIDDRLLGEKSCLFVKWKSTETLSTKKRQLNIKQYIQEYGLATFKIPDEIIFLDEFPYTAFGKINKKQLKKTLLLERSQ